MGLRQRLSSALRLSGRSLILFAILTAAGCKTVPLPPKVDPCGVFWDEEQDGAPYLAAWCQPLNQPGKPAYQRKVVPGDVVVRADEYATLQKYQRDMDKEFEAVLKKCAERCQ